MLRHGKLPIGWYFVAGRLELSSQGVYLSGCYGNLVSRKYLYAKPGANGESSDITWISIRYCAYIFVSNCLSATGVYTCEHGSLLLMQMKD